MCECGAEHVHDVGTEPVHTKRRETLRVGRLVDRPDDHATASAVNRVDQHLVDHLTMWPVVPGFRCAQRVHRIDQVRVGQHTDGAPGVGVVDVAGDAMIEAVDRRPNRRVPAKAFLHQPLDAPCLDLDEDLDRALGRVEDLVEARRGLARRPHRCRRQLRPVHRGDAGSGQRPGCRRQDGIVMDDHHPIPRGMHIELPAIRAGGNGGEEPREGILAVPSGHAAMGDQGGERATGHLRRGGAGVELEEGQTGDLNIAAGAASAYQTDMPDLIRAGDDAEEDRALIARWNGGDQRAATALVERHAPALARFVGSLGALAAPQELVQDTFVRAFGSLDSFRGDSSLRSWLFTIARRLVLDERRARRRDRDHVTIEDAQDQLVSADDVLDGVVADESEGRVRQAVARLSPLQREVFTLRVVEGLSYKEIAVIASTTEGAARVHYHNAMRAVKEFLDA